MMMKHGMNQREMMFYVAQIVIIVLCTAPVSLGHSSGDRDCVEMPFRAISGSSEEIRVYNGSLTCDEPGNDVEHSGSECLNRSRSGSGCPGFYTDSSSSSSCFICCVATIAEIQANNFTAFTDNSTLFVLYTERPEPRVSVNFDQYISEGGNFKIPGVNTEGTTENVDETDFVPGKRNLGLHFHSGGEVYLSGSGTECWTNFEHCPSGLTMSIWMKITDLKLSYVVGTGAVLRAGVSLFFNGDGELRTMVQLDTTR